jgi:hypothetical protein
MEKKMGRLVLILAFVAAIVVYHNGFVNPPTHVVNGSVEAELVLAEGKSLVNSTRSFRNGDKCMMAGGFLYKIGTVNHNGVTKTTYRYENSLAQGSNICPSGGTFHLTQAQVARITNKQ